LNIHEILQFDCDRYLTAILADGRSPECGANRSKASRTQFIEERERDYPQFMLKTGEGSERQQNEKGCDIGYVPAICSCEGAYSVDPCTVAALDAITDFAVPNPGSSSQSQPVFSGLVALQVTLLSRSLSLLRTGKVLFRQSFQPSTPAKLNSCFLAVNANLRAITKYP
jgi:hypothetical protein